MNNQGQSITSNGINSIYSYLYENTENPIMVLNVPVSIDYPNENHIIFLATCKENEIHISDVHDTFYQEYTDSYLGKTGLMIDQIFPYGMGNDTLFFQDGYLITQEGKFESFYRETLYQYDSLLDSDGWDSELFTEIYGNSTPMFGIGEVSFHDMNYLIYYSYDEMEANQLYVDKAKEKGISFTERELWTKLNGDLL